jgi:hypothetical protein
VTGIAADDPEYGNSGLGLTATAPALDLAAGAVAVGCPLCYHINYLAVDAVFRRGFGSSHLLLEVQVAGPEEQEPEPELPTVVQEGLQRQQPGKLEDERPAGEGHCFDSVILLIDHYVGAAVEL